MERTPRLVSNPNKSALQSRLHNERRFTEYKAYRETLKERGISDRIAWQVAAQKFPPLDGSQNEVPMTPEIGEILKTLEAEGVTEPQASSDAPPTEAKPQAEQGGWMALFDKIQPTEKLNIPAIIDFAFEYRSVPPDKIDPGKVPSRGALDLVQAIRSQQSYMDFLRTMFVKRIPEKKQLEYLDRMKDEGQQLLDLIESFEAKHFGDEQGAEDVG